ncbi:MAG: MBL fold metallo-hydrolase [Polyangia bacterium]
MSRYPHSQQWHKDRFQNPSHWPKRTGIRDVLRWQLGDRPARDHQFVPPLVQNDGSLLRANRSDVSVTWIGHATLLIQLEGLSILTDPNFASRMFTIRRTAPPGVSLSHLPPIDAVVVSHNHRDHLDEASVKALGPDVLYIVPLGLAGWFVKRGLRRVVELDWWHDHTVRANGGAVRFTFVPAQHWSGRGLRDHNQSLWGGFVIESAAARFYFSGDTGYPAAFAEIGKRFPDIHFALLPIGAYAPRWFMSPQHIDPAQAVLAFGELGARKLVPMHWGTFQLSDEPMAEPPQLLHEAMGTESARILGLAIGETHWSLQGK